MLVRRTACQVVIASVSEAIPTCAEGIASGKRRPRNDLRRSCQWTIQQLLPEVRMRLARLPNGITGAGDLWNAPVSPRWSYLGPLRAQLERVPRGGLARTYYCITPQCVV
jgi:hypothetical protein